MISSTLLAAVFILARARYLILDTVKVQRPPFSVVEVDCAGRERSVGIFRGGSQRGVSLFGLRHNKI